MNEPKRVVLPPASREEMYRRAGLKAPDQIATRASVARAKGRGGFKRRARPS